MEAIFSEQSGEAEALREASRTLPLTRYKQLQIAWESNERISNDKRTHWNRISERFSSDEILLEAETYTSI